MEYWQKQTDESPLFEDILWARPENKRGAGKLMIAGGSVHGFAAVGQSYAAAEEAGAGTVRVILPDALKRTVGPLGPYEFAPSTASGAFASDALNELLIGANWSDAVLLAGDFGRNSETAILLEKFADKYSGPLVITKDAVEYFMSNPETVLNRQDTAVVMSLGQLQKIGTAAKFDKPFLLGMGLMLLVQALHDFTQKHPVAIVTKEHDNLVVAYKGRVSTTKLEEDLDIWRVTASAKASVFWMQNPGRPYESITSSLI